MCSIDQGWVGELRPLCNVLWKARGTSAPKETESCRQGLKIPQKKAAPDKNCPESQTATANPFHYNSNDETHLWEPWIEDFRVRLVTVANDEQMNESVWRIDYLHKWSAGIVLDESIEFSFIFAFFSYLIIIGSLPSVTPPWILSGFGTWKEMFSLDKQ